MAYHSREGRPPRTMEVGLDRFSRQSVLGWVHGEDAPWTGGVIPQNKVRSHVSGSQLQDPVYSAYGYRDPAPSEADTIAQGGVPPSDSGYATQTHFDNVSLYSQPVDRSQEIQSLVRQMDDLGNINLVQGVGSGLPQSPIGAHPGADKGLFCTFPGCKKPFCKTRSELNKHDARHSKPHKCNIAGCGRVEGFSTPNDLARHKQSVHGVDGIKYVCNEGQCRGKEKLWPRADNFRAHLERMHQIKVAADDLDRFVYKEPSSISSHDVMYLSNLGAPYDPATLPHIFPGDMSPISPDKSQDDGSNLDLGTDAQPRNYDMSVSEEPSRDVYGPSGNIGLDSMSSSVPRDSHAQQLPEFVRPNMLSSPMTIDSSARPSSSRTSELGVPPPERGSVESIDLTSDESMRDDSSDVPSVATIEEGRSSSISFGNESSACGESIAKESRGILASLVDDDLESADLSDDRAAKLVEKLEKIGILEKLGYKQTKQASSAPEPKVTLKKPASNPSSENQLSFSCPDCHKAFARNCELKKHKKRHDKPYGCTFRNCRKNFGSKNDWKRHENSQHFQLEVWKCDYHPPSTDVACGKVSHRRETFRSHLQRDHSLQDFEIEKRLDSCRTGRNCEGAFWCGFCRKRVPLLKKGQEGWNERFDHIDSHFFGRNGRKMDIGEWEDIDPDQKRLDEDGGESDSDAGAPLGARRKRRHDGEPDAEEVERQRRPRHRQNGQPVTLVTCCHCNIMQCNLRFTKICAQDGHQFCTNCPKETTWVNEESSDERS